MKTPFKLTQNKTSYLLGLIMTLFIGSLAFTPANAQNKKASSTEISQNERIIKGMISDSNGPLESASVVLKGTKTGTTTNSKGEFTFPTPLKTGDILLISYLGYDIQQAEIKENTDFLRLMLTEDLIEFAGALNTDKPYRSKRSN